MDDLEQAVSETMSQAWADNYEQPGPDLFAKVRSFAAAAGLERATGLTAFHQQFLSAHAPRTLMLDKSTGRPRSMIMLGSNSYLALTAEPRVVEASIAAAKKYGYGAGSVPIYAGTTDLHTELENRLAKWYRCEDAILFASGYAANTGAISALVRPGDAIINDLFNHASIYDGCRLSGANMHVFAHRNMKHLERTLKKAAGDDHGTLVITDGVFSMEGDVAPLDEIIPLARQYGARVMLDDAHALGVIGPTGRGTAEQCGVEGQVDATMGTLSKCLGGIGACVAGSSEMVEYLRFYARSHFFSAAVPAPAVAGALAALDIIEKEPQLRESLWQNVRYLADNIKAMGYDIGQTQSAIIPVIVGDEYKLKAILIDLLAAGIFTNYVAFPAVPKARCRLRLSVMAGHPREDLDFVLETLRTLGRKHGVI